MYKLLSSNIEDDNYISLSLEDRNNSAFIKTAAKRDLPKEVDEAVKGMVRKPNHAYILVTAMGDGETWGANKNGDFFPYDALLGMQNSPVWGLNPGKDERMEEKMQLKHRYKTFEDAYFFKHHKNKFGRDPHFGYVERAIWNPKMRTVLLIIGVDRHAAPDTAAKIDANELVAVSMGAKLPWDRCSICGSQHKTLFQYCPHLKFEMGKILHDGRRVCAENLFPRFFDISEVTKPAFLAGMQLEKIAREGNVDFSIDLAEQYDIARHDYLFDKHAETEKNAVLYKQIPAHIEGAIARVCQTEKDLPKRLMDELAKLEPKEAWGALTRAGILVKPNEFAYILLKHSNKDDLAEEFINKKAIISKATPKGLDERLHDLANIEITHKSEQIAKHIPQEVKSERSIGALNERVYQTDKGLRKQAEVYGAIGLGAILSGLYMLYRKNAQSSMLAYKLIGGGIGAMAVDSALSPQRDKYIGNDPYYTEAMNKEAGALKTVGLAAAGFAAPYIASAHFQNKVERGEPVGMIGRAVANNPAKLGIVGAAGMLNPRAFYQGTKTVLRDATHGVKGLLS